MKPTKKSFREICKIAQEEFYEANGYYPTPEEAVRLTDEARAEIAKEKSEIIMEEKMFYDKVHWQAFTDCIARMKCSDVYHISLAYLLTLDTVCREHLDSLFDFENDGIKRKALNEGWQTGTSKKTTRLAFNLWNGCCDDGEKYKCKDGYDTELPSQYYAPDEIFCCSLAPYYWEAIKLRYPEYTSK